MYLDCFRSPKEKNIWILPEIHNGSPSNFEQKFYENIQKSKEKQMKKNIDISKSLAKPFEYKWEF